MTNNPAGPGGRGAAGDSGTAGDSGLATAFDQLLAGAAGDPAPLYARARSNRHFFSPRFNGWIFARHEDVRAILQSEAVFPPLIGGPGTASIYGRTVLQMSGAEHAAAVAPVARSLRSGRRLSCDIAEIVTGVVQPYLQRIAPYPAVTDLRRDFFSPFPMEVICVLMGLEDAAALRASYGDVVAAATSNVNGDPVIHARGEAARQAVFDFLRPAVSRRLAAPGDDLLSQICTLVTDGGLASADLALSYALFLFIAGVETTERTLTSLCAHVIGQPELWEAIRQDRALVSAAITEALRLSPPVQAVSRGVAAQTRIGAVELQPGDRVLVLIGAANRDDAIFAEPDRFELTRFLGRETPQFTPAGELMSFGTGVHHCTGSKLARLEMSVALNLLLDRVVALEWAGGDPPTPEGYVLRAPAALPVRLRPAA